MKIDTRARMAIAAILDVAIHGASRPVRLADICTRRHVSQSYLEHLFKNLRDGGVVSSIHGPGGGYRLKRRLANISVADIVSAVDGHGDRRDVSGDIANRSGAPCRASDGLWSRLDNHLRDYLRTVTLESLLTSDREAADLQDRSALVVAMPDVEPIQPRQEDRPAARA